MGGNSLKGDFTRSTFKSEKKYSSVRMQQGRVQLDADWNEQMDIYSHRIEKGSADLIGACGVPLSKDGGGFKIDVTSDKKNLTVSKGRIYVDGILCENSQTVKLTDQEDFPGSSLPDKEGTYLAYLEAWQRHITAIEDPQIREVALGGPDTATRTKIVWQVRLEPLKRGPDPDSKIDCAVIKRKWSKITEKSDGTLAAFTKQETPTKNPCIISPSAGYRRLENQLYRVEIHKGGKIDDNIDGATFKWSRDNGSVVFAIEEFIKDPSTNLTTKIKVKQLGKDKTLSLQANDWVEVLDDASELSGAPAGKLVKIVESPDMTGRVLTLDKDVSEYDIKRHPRVRRWDQKKDAITITSGSIELEDGILVRFSGNNFRAGDYWLIPARTATENTQETGKIEWPRDESKTPPEISMPPEGIAYHYCPLGVLQLNSSKEWIIKSDCRESFPAVTELTSFFHVCGNGQEAMPNEELPLPLQVGVSSGKHPVEGALVRFEVIDGGGTLSADNPVSTSPLIVKTDSEGVAKCKWKLGNLDSNNPSLPPTQLVEARLFDVCYSPVNTPIRFNANLSVASQVACILPDCTNIVTFNITGTNYEYAGWAGEQYPLIDLFKEKYIPLLANGDPIWKCHVNKLAKLVLDSKDRHVVKTGDTLDLGQSYAILVKQVDVDGKKVWLEFDKDGTFVDDQIIEVGDENAPSNTWNVELDDIQGEDNVRVLRLHVNQVFQGAVDSVVQIEGIWLIDYANARTLNIGDKVGEYILTDINEGNESNPGSLIFGKPNTLEIKTVQEVLDLLLCRKSGGEGCCVTASNAEELKKALEELKDGSAICLLAGEFKIEHILLKERNNIVIRGCTPASRLIGDIEIINCENILIENLSISGNLSARGEGEEVSSRDIIVKNLVFSGSLLAENVNNFSLKSSEIFQTTGQSFKVRFCSGVEIDANSFRENEVELEFDNSYDLKVQNNNINTQIPGMEDGGTFSCIIVRSSRAEIIGNVMDVSRPTYKGSLTVIRLEEMDYYTSVIGNSILAIGGLCLGIKANGRVRVHKNSFILGSVFEATDRAIEISSPKERIIFTDNFCDIGIGGDAVGEKPVHLISIEGMDVIFNNNHSIFQASPNAVIRQEMAHVFITGYSANVIGNRCNEENLRGDNVFSIFSDSERAILIGNITANQIKPQPQQFNLRG
jgi:S-layer protein (TIGR01567 family)